MNRTLVLVGKSGSGKTTIARYLAEVHGFKWSPQHTTRPPREGEVNGREYQFIKEKDFWDNKFNGMYAETTNVQATFGDVHYGTTINAIRPSDNKRKVTITNQAGCMHLNKRPSMLHIYQPFIVYLDIDEERRIERLRMRGDDIQEIKRRQAAESLEYIPWDLERLWDLRIEEAGPVDATVKYILREMNKEENKR